MGEWDASHLENIDHLIMPYINLCNVACGGHAGSYDIMDRTIKLAIANDVEVGAHPGYADRVNFGRNYIGIGEQDLKDLLRSQIDAFINIADQVGAVPNHIKPHGALYHACNHREMEMNILIEVMKREYSHLTLFVFPDSLLHKMAISEQMTFMVESFIDRGYTTDFKLLSRNIDGSVITSTEQAKAQFENLSYGKVITRNGFVKKLVTDTACIHGDNPNVLEILKSIRS